MSFSQVNPHLSRAFLNVVVNVFAVAYQLRSSANLVFALMTIAFASVSLSPKTLYLLVTGWR